ncbi:hypothetical protein [Streptomyces sp. NPDC055056]
MSGQLWVSLISLSSITLSGSLPYLVQHRTQRPPQRAEHQRQQIALSETRRGEQLALLERFIEAGAETERSAFSRPTDREATDPWFRTTRDVMNRL